VFAYVAAICLLTGILFGPAPALHVAKTNINNVIRHEVQALDRDQPVFTIRTLGQVLAEDLWPFRVFGGMFPMFSAIALVRPSVGLNRVMAYSVTHQVAVQSSASSSC
jgi:hypothetical protein